MLPVHGMTNTRFHNIWLRIRERTYRKSHVAYHNYGGRGIVMCDEWLDFLNFKKDMFVSYNFHVKKYGELDTTIDRVDNNKNYCKENCRWATNKEQANNMRTNRVIEYKGEKKNLIQWAEQIGISRDCIARRLDKYKWSIEDALTRKIGGKWRGYSIKIAKRNSKSSRQITFKGKTQSLAAWAEEKNINRSTISDRIDKSNWSIEKALTTPVPNNK